MSKNLKQQFEDQGWIRVPNAIERGLVESFKDEAISKWNSMGRPRMLLIDDVLTIEPVLRFQFNENLVRAIKSVFLRPCYINDIQLIFNMYEIHPRNGGWHIDAGSEVRYGAYLRDPGYRFAKVGIYFQSNSLESGGGIDVIAKSHRQYSSSSALGRGLYRLRNAGSRISLEYGLLRPKHLAINAGDAVIFDSRLLHRTSTPPFKELASQISIAKHDDPKIAARKIVMYWNICELGQEAPFLYNSYRRSLSEEAAPGNPEVYFTRYLARRFPDDYSSQYVDGCNRNGISVAQPPEAVCSFMREKYRKLAFSVSDAKV